jgi:hypothetical protein
MSNINGLTSLAPVYITGAPDSNIWATRVEPTVINTLTVVSPDGTKSGIVAESNDGDMTIGTASGIVNIISDDGVSDNFLFSNNDVLEVVGLNGALIESYNSGVTVIAGAQASVKVGAGALGQIYDTVYNPVTTLSLLNNNTTGEITYDNTATRAAGVYQVQLSIESTLPSSSTFLTIACSAPPSTSTINFSGAAINASAVALTNQDVALNTGYFTHAGGSLRVVVQSSGAAWSGTWSLQLVKMG